MPSPTASSGIRSAHPSTTSRCRRSSARPGRGGSISKAGGTRRVYRVHQVGDVTYVDASDGSSALSEVPRFGDPEKTALAGSLLAPMPGLVLRVLTEVGAVVTAGQPLLVLEAMKMEQTVAAPLAVWSPNCAPRRGTGRRRPGSRGRGDCGGGEVTSCR